MSEIHALFVMGLIAVLAPLLTRLPWLARMPEVVLQLMLGILIGPSVLGFVSSEGAIGFLGQFGLIFLLFQAGFEFNPREIGAGPLKLGAQAWLAAFALSGLYAGCLTLIGILHSPLLVALVLPTTAFGMLLPILQEGGNLGTNFGRHVLGLAVAGEIGPLVLASIVLAHQHHHLHETILTFVFFAAVVTAILAAQRLRSRKTAALIASWMHDRSILPVRIALLVLLGLVSLANELGMELVLGAYTAGAAIAVLVRDTRAEILETRLMTLGSGFFIPLFFITSGVEFDLPGLFTSPGSILRLILFFAGFVFIRLIPALLYKGVLAETDILPLALLSSSTMPLVVAVTFLGVRSGDMLPENAHALVGAAVITVTLLPIMALMLQAKPDGALARAIYAGKDRVRGHWSRLLAAAKEKASGKPEARPPPPSL